MGTTRIVIKKCVKYQEWSILSCERLMNSLAVKVCVIAVYSTKAFPFSILIKISSHLTYLLSTIQVLT